MIPHLTDSQLDLLLHAPNVLPNSESDSEVAAHLRACPECAAEVSALQAALAQMRVQATATARNQLDPGLRASLLAAQTRTGVTHFSRLRGATLALAACLLLAAGLSPLVLHDRSGTSPVAPVVAQPAATHDLAADEALLREIDQQVSASVPTALEPLANPPAQAKPETSTPANRKED